MEKANRYKDLEIWKQGIQIVSRVYSLIKRFPSEEKFGLVSQMQRAAVSIPANIAEGFARRYAKEFKRFCLIALGSCSELETLVFIAQEQGFMDSAEKELLEEMLDKESKMIMSLTKKLG
ncbi:MAG: four helix bundle protein [Deltaproteobacteria bacterium]|nr:four helix bundle protein [Deltaproteobacteria bacterium]